MSASRVSARLSVAALLLLVSCADGVGPPLVFDFPPGASQGAEILVVAREGRADAFVIPLDRSVERLPIEVDDQARVELEALVFAEEPAALGLAVGPLPAADGGATDDRRTPRATFTTAIEGGVAAPWVREDAPSPRGARYLPASPCPRFAESPPIPGTEARFVGATAIDARSALVIAGPWEGPTYFVAREDGLTEVSSPLPAGYTPVALTTAADGRLLIATRGILSLDAAVFAGSFEGGLRLLQAPPPLPCAIAELEWARPTSGAPDLFLIDECGRIERLRDDEWTTIHAGDGVASGRRQLAWVDERTLLFSSADGTQVRRIQDGREDIVASDLELAEVTVIESLDGLGTFVGLWSGWVLEYRDERLATFRPPFISNVSVESFTKLGGGLVIGGGDGDLQSYVHGEFCPRAAYVGSDHSLFDLVALEFGLVGAGLSGRVERRFFTAIVPETR